MKTKKNLFFAIAILTGTGCVSTPRLNGPPVAIDNTNYKVAQPPVKLEVANKGPQWNRFVRDYNAERLGHNLRLAEIENRGVEQKLAKEVEVEYTPPALGQPQPQPQATYGNSGVPFYTPYPQYPESGYGSRWWQFFGRPTYYSPSPSYGTTYYYGGAGVAGATFQSGLWNGNCGREQLFGIGFQKSSPGYKDFWGSQR